MRHASDPGTVAQTLAKDRLGVPSVMYFILAGIAPLTVAAGVIPTAFAVTGQVAIPAAFLLVAGVLMVFCPGYLAMARHIRNAGAFYAYIARGLGRPAGVGAALVALVGYNLLQVGLYGALGPAAAGYAADNAHRNAPWWIWALIAWAVVTMLGLVPVHWSGRLLGVLCTVEILVIIALTVSGLLHPAGNHLSVASLSPTSLTLAGAGAVLAIAVLGFVGFEQAPLLGEEARSPRRTVPHATYLALGLIALVYAAASWAMVAHYGGHVVTSAQQQGPGLLFALGTQLLASTGRTFFLTSLFAAALAYHVAVGRYMYALGREHVLPPVFGRVGRTGVPLTASLTQSLVGLIAILVTRFAGWDPMNQLFFWGGTTGAFGILLLATVTSAAVVVFFARTARGETLWSRRIAPALSTVVLTTISLLCLSHYSLLLGIPPGSAAARWLPASYAIAAAIGIGWALILRARRPAVYAVIGLGPDAVGAPDTVSGSPAALASADIVEPTP
jgi:amino acid transporter